MMAIISRRPVLLTVPPTVIVPPPDTNPRSRFKISGLKTGLLLRSAILLSFLCDGISAPSSRINQEFRASVPTRSAHDAGVKVRLLSAPRPGSALRLWPGRDSDRRSEEPGR